ncbi:hypothetical protein BCR35DRAFT_303116 [Leucosporidium creatinivorum]|uniref:Uncharacterized protein n=1 Tax=Leucosporidium creatinivorum TaxID=106004 RepID=A0A1Y2FJC9_9BASI|nr:hypothetical protein BCR35DRAFT_303116 [Leucosporidium creatinivorum]
MYDLGPNPPSSDNGHSAQPISFLRLRDLKIQASSIYLPSYLALFQHSPISWLEIELDDDEPTTAPRIASMALEKAFKVLAGYQYIQRLQIDQWDKRHTELNLAIVLTRLAKEHGIHISLLPPYDVFLHRKRPNGDPGTRQEQKIRRCDGVDDVLRHTLAQSGRMRATGDLEGVEQLIEALTPSRTRMLRDKD